MGSDTSYYEILGVPDDASAEEIKQRYKALVLKFHPDREGSALAADAMVSINRAYEVLSDPQKRQAYDRDLWVESSGEPQEGAPTRHSTGPAPGRKPYIVVDTIGRKEDIFVIVAIAASFLAGLLVLPTGAEGRTIASQFISDNRDVMASLLHGGLVALPLVIPGFGTAWGILMIFMAGLTDSAVLTAVPGTPGSAGNLLLFASLAAGLKILACYFGMCRSILLVQAIRRRRFSRVERIHTGGDIILVMTVSALAGFFEFVMSVSA